MNTKYLLGVLFQYVLLFHLLFAQNLGQYGPIYMLAPIYSSLWPYQGFSLSNLVDISFVLIEIVPGIIIRLLAIPGRPHEFILDLNL